MTFDYFHPADGAPHAPDATIQTRDRVLRHLDAGGGGVLAPMSKVGIALLSGAVHSSTTCCVNPAYEQAYQAWKEARDGAPRSGAADDGASSRSAMVVPIVGSRRRHRAGATFPPEVGRDFGHLLRYELQRDQPAPCSDEDDAPQPAGTQSARETRALQCLLEGVLPGPTLSELRSEICAQVLLTDKPQSSRFNVDSSSLQLLIGSAGFGRSRRGRGRAHVGVGEQGVSIFCALHFD